MRFDKYLKVSRIIKRRTVAKEIADQGRIDINGKTAKSSNDVKTGDELTIRFGNKTSVLKVESTAEVVRKEQAEHMYSIVSESYEQDFGNDEN